MKAAETKLAIINTVAALCMAIKKVMLPSRS